MKKIPQIQIKDYALITGASSGIGEEYAKRFASMGCNLILIARNKNKLDYISHTLKISYDINIEVIEADLSKDSDITKVEECINQKDSLVVLVNCAGFTLRKQFDKQDPLKQLSMIQLHIIASTRLARAALSKMIMNNRGIIINVSSLLSLMTLDSNVVYYATKSYLNRFSQNLRLELKGKNIQIQALNPGNTITNFHSTEEFSGVENRYPKLFTLTVDKLVDKSIAAIKRKKVIVVPGLANQLLVNFKFLFAGIIMKSMR